MTRGTLYIILPKGKVISSCEFNGDMYGSPNDPKELREAGHYSEMIERLKRVLTEADFRKEILAFDKKSFEYSKEKSNYFRFYKNNWKQEWTDKSGVIDMREDKYLKRFFSDYLFFKNLSGEPVGFKDRDGKLITVQDREIITFDFGRFITTHKS